MIFYNETSEFWFSGLAIPRHQKSLMTRGSSEDYYRMMEDIEQHWWIHCYLRKDSAKYKWIWSYFMINIMLAAPQNGETNLTEQESMNKYLPSLFQQYIAVSKYSRWMEDKTATRDLA